MKRAHLPFLVVPSHAAAALVGRDLDVVAVLALKAILQHRKGLEVAHQQIRYRKHDLAVFLAYRPRWRPDPGA